MIVLGGKNIGENRYRINGCNGCCNIKWMKVVIVKIGNSLL